VYNQLGLFLICLLYHAGDHLVAAACACRGKLSSQRQKSGEPRMLSCTMTEGHNKNTVMEAWLRLIRAYFCSPGSCGLLFTRFPTWSHFSSFCWPAFRYFRLSAPLLGPILPTDTAKFSSVLVYQVPYILLLATGQLLGIMSLDNLAGDMLPTSNSQPHPSYFYWQVFRYYVSKYSGWGHASYF
jgi:hypothetical protein